MKIKFIKLIILTLVLLMLLPSCENNKEITSETQQPAITSATVKPETTETTSQQNTTQSKSTQQTTVFQTSDTQQTTTTSTAVQTGTEKTTPKQTLVTQVSDTVKISTTTQLSENEYDNLCGMPEIVFIINHCYYQNNGFGFYITNNGMIKSYDFRKIKPKEYSYIGDYNNYNILKDIGVDTDFDPILKEQLTELYEKLLNVADDSELIYSYVRIP